MKKYTQEELDIILAEHKEWVVAGGGEQAGMRRADLSGANLCGANLSGADLSDADMRRAYLSDANLSGADLSGAKGLLSPIEFMETHFTKTEQGYIVYKTFGNYYSTPNCWDIKEGATIEETVNSCRSDNCGCGVNVATLTWIKQRQPRAKKVWKLLIKWEWLVGVVVPYGTDGKIRCERAMLLEEIEI